MRARVREAPAAQYDSRLEADWAQMLELQRRAGQIIHWAHHAITLKLVEGARYSPDFLVIRADREIELQEVKGFMREAAGVRLKVAAELYPWFRFVLVRRGKGARGQWTCDEVRG